MIRPKLAGFDVTGDNRKSLGLFLSVHCFSRVCSPAISESGLNPDHFSPISGKRGWNLSWRALADEAVPAMLRRSGRIVRHSVESDGSDLQFFVPLHEREQ